MIEATLSDLSAVGALPVHDWRQFARLLLDGQLQGCDLNPEERRSILLLASTPAAKIFVPDQEVETLGQKIQQFLDQTGIGRKVQPVSRAELSRIQTLATTGAAHETNRGSCKMYTCGICEAALGDEAESITFTSKTEYEKHRQIAHGIARASRGGTRTPREIPPCPICEKRFTARRYLNRHAKEKHGVGFRAVTALIRKIRRRQNGADDARLKQPRAVRFWSIGTDNSCGKSSAPTESAKQNRQIEAEVGPIETIFQKRSAAIEDHLREVTAPSQKSMREAAEANRAFEDRQRDNVIERAMSWPLLQLLVPDDTERRVFLLHCANRSLAEVAVEVFGTAAKKPHVQKIVERCRAACQQWVGQAHRESAFDAILRDYINGVLTLTREKETAKTPDGYIPKDDLGPTVEIRAA